MKTVYKFLSDLKHNNNRDWFNDNKDKYNEAKNIFENYINSLIPKLKKIDKSVDINSAKECMFRIYKDVRFSKNKLPYKTNFGAVMAKGGRKSLYAGYYIHIEPESSFVGGGIYMPQAKILKAVRDNIFFDSAELKKILNNTNFKKYFSDFIGDKLKTAPRGFPKDFKDIKLLRYKNFAVSHNIDNDDITSEKSQEKILEIFKAQKPLNEYLNKIVENIN